ncbi:MAG: BamA/TamA family outer membrane protein [Bacteroidales bacterium]|nr:BamA/TamA family outer membrane protein [Bacteroidales bacterium]
MADALRRGAVAAGCVGWLLLLSGCSATRKIPEGQYLLNRADVLVADGRVGSSTLKGYLKQQPNVRILGFRFHLRMYNIPRKDEGNNAIGRWLKRMGEPPVLLDTNLVTESTSNVLMYLHSKGHYMASVEPRIRYQGKKANVLYLVRAGAPYTVAALTHSVPDVRVDSILRSTASRSLIELGQNFDLDVLQEERTRVETMLRNRGYFNFSRDLVRFSADTTLGNRQVALNMLVRPPSTDPAPFRRYSIKKVFVHPRYDPMEMMSKRVLASLDTVQQRGSSYIYYKDAGIDLDVIDRFNRIKPGAMYSSGLANRTRDRFSSLKMYRYVDIGFQEDTVRAGMPADSGLLNCTMFLSQNVLQSYNIEPVFTSNTAGSVGGEATITYQHRNMFRGGVVFDARVRGMFETNADRRNSSLGLVRSRWTREYGTSVGFNFPKYMGPFHRREVIARANINTQISASFSYQNRPQFVRLMASTLYGYSWASSRYISHVLNPVEINLIRIQDISDDFNARLQNSILKYSYMDQIVTVSSYGLTFSNRRDSHRNYVFLRFNVELSGNALSAAYSALRVPRDSTDGTYKMMGISFSQFVRSDVNFTYHQVINRDNAMAYRAFFGIGIPYGNSRALPFEKRYYAGGTNSIRAWQARDIGPGSTYQADRYPNQTADLKLELNAEYRFKVAGPFEGALFVDAGNVWSLPHADIPEEEVFSLSRFYRQMALGAGLGFRLNFSVLVLRLDLGYKVYDPAQNPDEPFRPWVPFQRTFSWRDHVNINFGIGYPF